MRGATEVEALSTEPARRKLLPRSLERLTSKLVGEEGHATAMIPLFETLAEYRRGSDP